MLALYHMAGSAHAQDLPGLDQILDKNGLTVPAKINRAVLVGTSRGPQDVLQRRRWPENPYDLGRAGMAARWRRGLRS